MYTHIKKFHKTMKLFKTQIVKKDFYPFACCKKSLKLENKYAFPTHYALNTIRDLK